MGLGNIAEISGVQHWCGGDRDWWGRSLMPSSIKQLDNQIKMIRIQMEWVGS